jgi:hypothetical protein
MRRQLIIWMVRLLVLVASEILSFSSSFSPIPSFITRSNLISSPINSHVVLYSSYDKSRISGNQREPTKEEIAIMDEMITKLAVAKPYDLPNAVQRAFRVISSPKFFLRIAELADLANEETEKAKLSALASNLISTVEAVMSTTEDKMIEKASLLEKVVLAAAEPDSGEFLVPLLPERVQSMQEAFRKLKDSDVDEGFLSTIDAWINKSYTDGMDLMVVILQKVLQMYAGRKILQAISTKSFESSDSSNLFKTIIESDAESWDEIIKRGIQDGLTPETIQSEVQSNMENIVFALETGSLSQRVQAEYLKEINNRVEQFKF